MMATLREKYWCTTHTAPCYRDLKDPNSPHRVMEGMQLKSMAQDVVAKRCTEDSPTPALLKTMKPITARGRRDDVAASSSSKRHRSSSPILRSSPPPGALDDHLQIAINACSRQHSNISAQEYKAAYNALQAKDYVPHSFPSLTPERLGELTGLPEGKAATLHAFCVKWAGGIDSKWKKRRLA
ncbi:hypothetical protein EXIGLDRAFT_434097 [Exidia glandulosa HHB12029]|nr:hypothetical protein EXIGLDRAFT_434097 [Exidia glandulosa HHB12029]